MPDNTEFIQIRIEPELKRQAVERAEKTERDLSKYIRWLIIRDLESAAVTTNNGGRPEPTAA